jgi:hypothetical protein
MASVSQSAVGQTLVEVLRWLLVLPAAWIGTQALPFVLRFIVPPAMAQLPGAPAAPVSDFNRYVLPLLVHAVAGALFVIVGVKTAPRGRRVVAIVLASLWCLLALLIHVLLHNSRGVLNYLHFAAAALGAIGAAISIFFSERARTTPADEVSASGK